MADRPHVAIIGYGHAGRQFHAYLVNLTSELVLRGIASRDAATRARIVADYGCRAYESLAAVLADPGVDLVVLATPNDIHARDAIQALAAGKHVVTDKPMCLNRAECEAMIAAAERAERVLSVFQNRRWDGDFLTLRQILGAGELGDLRWLEMAWLGARPPRGWRARPECGGGRLFDLGAHMLDQVLLLMPAAVTSVYCRMQHDYGANEVESHCVVTIGFADGATAVIDVGSRHFAAKPRLQAFGSAGAFTKYGLDPQEAAMKAGDIDAACEGAARYGRLTTAAGERDIPTVRGRWRTYYELIAAQITGTAVSDAPVRYGEMRRLMAVFDAAFESARTGAAIRGAIAPASVAP